LNFHAQFLTFVSHLGSFANLWTLTVNVSSAFTFLSHRGLRSSAQGQTVSVLPFLHQEFSPANDPIPSSFGYLMTL
jgi:hypothetical protein